MKNKNLAVLAVIFTITVLCCILFGRYMNGRSNNKEDLYVGRAQVAQDLQDGESICLLSSPDVRSAVLAGRLEKGAAVEIVSYTDSVVSSDGAADYVAKARFDASRFVKLSAIPGGRRTDKYAYAVVNRKDIESTAEAVISIAVWKKQGAHAVLYKGVAGPVDYLPHVCQIIDRWALVKIAGGLAEGYVPAMLLTKIQ